MNTSELIAQLGETDQQFLQQNSPELALQRGTLRLALVNASQRAEEQRYFLQQAIVILEQARLEFAEMPMALYLALSMQLAKTYLAYFDLTQEQRYALIAEQILKPLAHHQQIELYKLLMQSAQAQQHPALASHWQKKARALAQKYN